MKLTRIRSLNGFRHLRELRVSQEGEGIVVVGGFVECVFDGSP
jgi:hypothetical protein